MHMLQPKGHGQSNHIKIIHNFFYQGSEPSSRKQLMKNPSAVLFHLHASLSSRIGIGEHKT
jgi:hypothetical protein